MPGGYGEGSARDEWGGVDPLAPSVTGGQITPAQWEDYQRRRRRAAILGTITTLGGMFGAQPLANAIGIGSGAGVASGSLPPIAGGSPWAVSPYVAPAAMSGTGAGAAGVGTAATVGTGAGTAMNAAGAGGGAGAGAGAGAGLAGMSMRDLISLGMAGAGTVGGLMQDDINTQPTSATTDPQMQMVLELMANRLRKSEPNFESVQAMAQGLLPTAYQTGGRGRG